MTKITISAVIPTYNRKELLKKCLLSLFSQTYPKEKFEIIVVDDGSSDNTETLVKTLQKKNPNLIYLKQFHGGAICARNLGIKKAKGEIIAFTDDDCLPRKNWLEQIKRAFKKNPPALGIEGKTLTNTNKITPFTAYIINTKGGGYQTCNIAYKRKILNKLGKFDKNFISPHCEDIDLALRILKHGPIIFEPKAIVIHPPRKTSFKKGMAYVNRIPQEFYLFLKHPDYFQKKYGKNNSFWQVVFKNSIWTRLFHLKHYSAWIRKNPLTYLKFALRTTLEVILIICFIPKFWLGYLKFKRVLPEVST